jgi:pimeloyl-ACP methyl ester carboxylesterase
VFYSSIISSKNPNLIFLHGWGGSWQSWHPILERLKSDFNLYAPDLPGFGQEPISKPYFLDDYVNFVTDFIKKNKIKNPILIGHSFGGAITSKIAIDKKISLSKIILVDSASIRHPYSTSQKNKFKIISFFKKIFPFTQSFYYKLTKKLDSDYASLKDNPILQKTFQNIIQHDLTNQLSTIKTPTLIIWGENDTDTPLTDGQKIHKLIPKSEFINYPKTSHFAYLEEQEKFTNDIKKFIKS